MIDLFYKSYAPDFEWLYYSLESVKKFVTGYNQVIIIISENEVSLFDYESIKGIKCKVIPVKEYGNGYLFQQVVKLKAYQYSNAEHILYMDSDCIFTTKVNVNDLLINGKFQVLYTPYESLSRDIDEKAPACYCWKEPTEKFIGELQQFEFMRRHPFLYRRDTLLAIANSYPDLEKRVMDSGGFSEFNAIGAWVFKYRQDQYDFINTEDCIISPPLLLQQHFSMNREERLAVIKSILTDNITMKIDITQVPAYMMSCRKEAQTERRKKTMLQLIDKLGFSSIEVVLGRTTVPYSLGAREAILGLMPKLKTPFIIFEDDATVLEKNYYPVLEIPEPCDILFLGGIPIGHREFATVNPQVITNNWNGDIGKYSQQISYIPINDDFIRILNMYSAHAILFLTEKGKHQYVRYVNSYPLLPHDVAFSYGMAQINTLMVTKPFFYQNDVYNSERTKQVIYESRKINTTSGEPRRGTEKRKVSSSETSSSASKGGEEQPKKTVNKAGKRKRKDKT